MIDARRFISSLHSIFDDHLSLSFIMSGQSGSGSGSGSAQNNSTPKAIGNLIKKQEDVTRRGTSKMKFTPTLPPRRKKECVETCSFARMYI